MSDRVSFATWLTSWVSRAAGNRTQSTCSQSTRTTGIRRPVGRMLARNLLVGEFLDENLDQTRGNIGVELGCFGEYVAAKDGREIELGLRR